jgi:argininosuccinate synthase
MPDIYLGLAEVLQAIEERQGCVLLYSGGLDGTHFLAKVARLLPKARVLPIMVDLGAGDDLTPAAEIARKIAGDCIVLDGVDEFVSTFVTPAILNNALYDSEYPISASLSRPFLASLGIQIARSREINLVIHTSTIFQNSSVRLTKALRRLDPGIAVGMPSFFDDPPRETKLEELQHFVAWSGASSLSSDRNIWCSEVESLPNVDPESGVDIHPFLGAAGHEHGNSRILQLRFSRGVPVALDGQSLPLVAMIRSLNQIGGEHGIGYHSWLEATPTGGKRLETRFCPAASILLKGHKLAEAATLTEHELSVKRSLEDEWVRLVSRGEWYSFLKTSIDSFTSSLSEHVSADLELQLQEGSISLLSVSAENRSYLRDADEIALSKVMRESVPTACKELLARLLFGDARTGRY